MNSNVLLAWPNYIDKAVNLFGGNYTNNLPLSNAKSKIFAKKARTVDTDPQSTQFSINLSGDRAINVVCLAAHNLSTSAKIRVRYYSNINQTELLLDSGTIDVWPAVYSSDQLEWEYTNYWEGVISQDDIEDFTPLFSFVTTETIIPVSIRVEIFDEINKDGYIEFGRIFIGESFQPKLNMQFGAQMGYVINSDVESAQDNTEYYDRKRPRRTASFQLDALTEDEAFNKIYSLQRTQGIDREVFFTYRNDQNFSYFARTFIGRLQQPDAISQPYFDRYSAPINLIEIL